MDRANVGRSGKYSADSEAACTDAADSYRDLWLARGFSKGGLDPGTRCGDERAVCGIDGLGFLGVLQYIGYGVWRFGKWALNVWQASKVW